MILATIDPWILAFSAATVIATIFMGFWTARRSKTASDFYVAGRSVSVGWNASAISGEYLSAASFMGVAGMVMSSGYDALWYPVCYACGYLFLLLFIAGPLRRFGAYTIPDFAEGRYDSAVFRKIAVCFVLFIGFFYTMPQMKGAGVTLAYIFPGLPYWVGVVLVGAVITLNVALGGMKGITLVQAFQYWAKMFAISVPIFVLMAVYGHYGKQLESQSSLSLLPNSQSVRAISVFKAAGIPEPDWSDQWMRRLGDIKERIIQTADRLSGIQTVHGAGAFTTSARDMLINFADRERQVVLVETSLTNTWMKTVVSFSYGTNSGDFVKSLALALQTNGIQLVTVGDVVVAVPTNRVKEVGEVIEQRGVIGLTRETADVSSSALRNPLPEKAPTDSTARSRDGLYNQPVPEGFHLIIPSDPSARSMTKELKLAWQVASAGGEMRWQFHTPGSARLPLKEALKGYADFSLTEVVLSDELRAIEFTPFELKATFRAGLLSQFEELAATYGIRFIKDLDDRTWVVPKSQVNDTRILVPNDRMDRKPLPEKAPADSTWLSPFGPLTTKAANAAGIRGNDAKPYSLLYTYSLIIALVCGTAGLPHILVRFYTNPDGVAAKRTTMWVMILIGIFYVFPPVFGVMGRNLMPELYNGLSGVKGTDGIVLKLPTILREKYGVLGSILSGVTCAGAFAAFMSTFSGLLVSMTGALAHDVYGRMLRPKSTSDQRLRAFKVCAVLIGGIAIVLGCFVEPLEINFMVGQAFAIAAASYFPLLFMSVWWRGMTMRGAAIGMLTGGLCALAAVTLTNFSNLALDKGPMGRVFAGFAPLNGFWAAHPLLRILCEQPAIWTVPLAIGLMIIVGKLTSRAVPQDIRMKMLVLHAPEKLGLKQEYIQEHQQGH